MALSQEWLKARNKRNLDNSQDWDRRIDSSEGAYWWAYRSSNEALTDLQTNYVTGLQQQSTRSTKKVKSALAWGEELKIIKAKKMDT